jgi:hypothetical protein
MPYQVVTNLPRYIIFTPSCNVAYNAEISPMPPSETAKEAVTVTFTAKLIKPRSFVPFMARKAIRITMGMKSYLLYDTGSNPI